MRLKCYLVWQGHQKMLSTCTSCISVALSASFAASSSSLPPLLFSQSQTCVAATITSTSSVCPTAPLVQSLWTTKPSGLPLSSREWLALQVMSPRDLISRICPRLANYFCVVSQVQAFFSLFHIAKTLIQTHSGCCSHVSQLLLCPVFFFLTNCGSHAFFISIWTVAVKIVIPICCLEFVITLFVSLHCLLLLYCNKCTTFPYFNLNIAVISTKRPTITSVWTVGSVSIISFSIFRHAFPIFHLSLHPGLGGNSHKCMQTCFIFWPQKVYSIDQCYYIVSSSSPIRLSDSI